MSFRPSAGSGGILKPTGSRIRSWRMEMAADGSAAVYAVLGVVPAKGAAVALDLAFKTDRIGGYFDLPATYTGRAKHEHRFDVAAESFPWPKEDATNE